MKTPVGSDEARRNGPRSEAIDTALVTGTGRAVAVTSDGPTPAMYRPARVAMADNFRFSD
jgi:hypothetical protein